MGKCKCDKKIQVSFCPKCKSQSVGYTFGFGNLFGIIPKMRCRDCGFYSHGFPILVTCESELKKAVEKMKRSKKKAVVKKKVAKKIKKVVKKK